MRHFAKVLVVAVFVSMVWTSSAHAAATWFKCTVIVAGMPTTNQVLIQLTDLAADPAFTAKTFAGTTANVKEMLAIALVAMSANLPVWVYGDPALALPPITSIYLAKQ